MSKFRKIIQGFEDMQPGMDYESGLTMDKESAIAIEVQKKGIPHKQGNSRLQDLIAYAENMDV